MGGEPGRGRMTEESAERIVDSPKRAQRVVRVPVYALIVCVFVMLISPVASVFAAVERSNANARRIVAEQERQRRAASEEARKVACSFFSISLDTYLENPPVGATGRALQANYLEFYRISGCQPPRTK